MGAALLLGAGASHAQVAPPQTEEQRALDSAPRRRVSREELRSRELLMYNGPEFSLGWRFWMVAIPRAFVGAFMSLQNGPASDGGFSGSTGIGTGPEFVYRNGTLDVTTSVFGVSYGAPGGFANPFYGHGLSEGGDATERITSRLFAVYIASTFSYNIRLHRMFEIQLGIGVGLGFLGGDLYRSQARGTDATGYTDCVMHGSSEPCNTNNDHYSNSPGAQGTAAYNPYGPSAYREPSWAGHGYLPVVIPWLSIPQLGFHIRPHRNFDIRIDAGYGLINLYVGGSLHYIF